MISRTKEIILRLLVSERSAPRLALAFCFGVFIAFSPLIGLHTIMMLGFAWWGRMNFAMMYAASHIVNNPFTIAPLFWMIHKVGMELFMIFFGVIPANPWWIEWMNSHIVYYTGLPGFSFWSFMLGGNLLGLIISVMLYPLVLWIFKHAMDKRASKAI